MARISEIFSCNRRVASVRSAAVVILMPLPSSWPASRTLRLSSAASATAALTDPGMALPCFFCEALWLPLAAEEVWEEVLSCASFSFACCDWMSRTVFGASGSSCGGGVGGRSSVRRRRGSVSGGGSFLFHSA